MNKYFNNVENLEELKNEYKKLVFKLHPDKGGKVEDFQEMQNEFEKLFKELQNSSSDKKEKAENINSFKDIINALIKYDTLNIYVVNSWVWVEGCKFEDKEIQEVLNNLGFKWSKKNKKHYFFEGIKESNGYKKGYKTMSWAEKTLKYGCNQVKKSNKKDEPKKLK